MGSKFLHLVLALAVAAVATAQDRPQVRTINVNGTGEVYVAPDTATVRLGVESEAKTAKEAMDQANRATSTLLGRLTQIGIPKEHIQTSRLTLQPVYENITQPGERTAPRVVGYRASNILSVRVDNLDLVGAVVDAVTASGGNRLQGISFGLRNDREARMKAMARAAENAAEKAQALAAALKLTLGRVFEVQEGGVQVFNQDMDMPMAGGRMEMAAAAPVAPGELKVTAFVTIRYEIGG